MGALALWGLTVALSASGCLLLLVSGSCLAEWGHARERRATLGAQRYLDAACLGMTAGAALLILAIVVRP